MQTVTSVSNAAKYLNMPNEVAAQAIAGLTSGAGSSNLMRQMGIYTADPRTGKAYTQGQIFSQMAGRLTAGQGKASVGDTMESLRRGNLGNFIKSSGLDSAQQALFSQYMIEKAKGNNMDLSDPKAMAKLEAQAKAGGNDNPFAAAMNINTSDTKAMGKAEDAYISGMNAAAKTIGVLNEAFGTLASKIGAINAYASTMGGSNAGVGGMGLAGSAAHLGMDYLEVKGAQTAGKAVMGKVAQTAAGEAIAGTAAEVGLAGAGTLAGGAALAAGGGYVMGKGAKVLGKAVHATKKETVAGGTLAGAGTGALIGAGVGSVVPVVGTAVGAVVGSIIGGIGGYFGSRGGPSSSVGMGTSSDTTGGGGSYAMPASGPITANFGDKSTLWKGGSHSGMDIGVPVGTPVHAAANGVVTGDNKGEAYGTHVVINHGGGYETIYGHLSAKSVGSGMSVQKGDLLGKSGKTGHVTGPHLHFEVRKNGVSVDPSALLGLTNPKSKDSKGGAGATSSSVIASVLGGSVGAPDIISLDASGKSITSVNTTGLLAAASPMMSDAVYRSSSSKSTNAKNADYSGTPFTGSIDDALKAAGFSGQSLAIAKAIAMAESSGRPSAHNNNTATGDDSYGLFQINMLGNMGPARRKSFNLSSNEDLYDPATNARVAYAISNGGTNWGPWSTFKNGAYKKFLSSSPSASQGMDRVPGDMPVNVHTNEAILNAADAEKWRQEQALPSKKGGITVPITVNIQNASETEARRFANLVKQHLENDSLTTSMGSM